MAQTAKMGNPIQVILSIEDRQAVFDIASVEHVSMAEVVRELVSSSLTLEERLKQSKRNYRARWREYDARG